MEGSGMAAVLDGIGGFGDDGDGGDGGDGGEEEPSVVYYCLEESTGYMQPALRALAVAHTIVAFLCIIGYNCLKVRPPKTPPKPPQNPPKAPGTALILSLPSCATPLALATPPVTPGHTHNPQPAFCRHAPFLGHAPFLVLATPPVRRPRLLPSS